MPASEKLEDQALLESEEERDADEYRKLLELYDEQGLGELPYPPDYPKMPGEPPRVQPSKKNPANWE